MHMPTEQVRQVAAAETAFSRVAHTKQFIERDVLPGGHVVVRPLQPSAPIRPVGLAYRSSSARVAGYRQLGDLIQVAGHESMKNHTSNIASTKRVAQS